MRFVDTNLLLYAISKAPEERDKATTAREILRRRRISYWDAAILEAARSAGCEVVLSEDLSDGEDYGGIRVENPFREVGPRRAEPGDEATP